MIDLEFSEQQQLLQHTARNFFAAQCPIARVRSLETSDLGYSDELWKSMAKLDWVGLSYPTELGGAAGSILDLYVLYAEMGRCLAPTPHLASSVIAGETIRRGLGGLGSVIGRDPRRSAVHVGTPRRRPA